MAAYEQGRPPGQATSFEEFWPHYLAAAAHRHPMNRALHYVGTVSAVLAGLVGVVTLNPVIVVAALPLGYGPAWLGHLFFEGNRPATFAHPLWSLRADFRMLGIAVGSAIHGALGLGARLAAGA
jgi:hypothetical protein